ncbi:MAG: hypothetical protein J1F02_06710 [Lachnospiraceae bacterium]|nr:hypothetical protein [Lachnospiraceae bacterium]
MFILCRDSVAKKPYPLPYAEQKVYSLEELCYYIYNNIYSINEDFFQKSLAVWLREEAGLPALAKKLDDMLSAEPSLKDLVVTVLCGCDYYREEEIRSLVDVMDGIANLPLYKKKKIKADNYLRAGRYGKSLLEYRKLLRGSFAVNFTTGEYGDILHNQGIAHFYTSSFAEAENDFKEAYVRNHQKSSLKHYLWLLLMQDKEQDFETEAVSFGMSQEEVRAAKNEYTKALSQCRVPEPQEGDIERYKEQLKKAFAC